MPAPNFQTLYDFETPLEDAFAAALVGLLAGVPLVATVSTARNRSFQGTPRIELYASGGGVLTQRTTANQARPKETPNAFEFQLVAAIVTTRSVLAGNSSIHGPLRGLVRYALSAGARQIGDANLLYHQILNMVPAGSTPQMIDEKDCDRTELTYTGQIAFKNGAWPAQA
jgi:hypothetical protein